MYKGERFENMIHNVLLKIKNEYFNRFDVTFKPKILLRNGEYVIPDFEMIIDLPHLKERYLIECQDRRRSSKTILHKIQHVRTQSSRNIFIYLYNATSSLETLRALRSEGILVFSYKEFIEFINKIRMSLASTPYITKGLGGGGGDEELQEE